MTARLYRRDRGREDAMPIFMIERNYAEQLDVNETAAAEINLINDDEGVNWLYSFLSADLRKTYCLYDAPSAEAIKRAAERAGLPADVVVEITEKVLRTGVKVAAV
ncbi:DUF4242 domain-containing protein [Actinoplanes sp. CA-030573]|uniref:DUF4242 domain-containing protein n=1 Tax=Actinoplanes sp. CA-030573 TaxID=3239898 RepID=UPI003D91B102